MTIQSSSALKDLLVTTKDGDWGKAEPDDNLLPYYIVRATDFAATSIGNISSVPIRYLPKHTVARRTLKPNDILVETAGGSPKRPTGRTMLVTEQVLKSFDKPITCASFARFLRPDPSKVDPRYLFWFLQALYQSGEIEQYQVQHTGIARFQYTQFAQAQQVPLPEMKTQKAIAEVLAALDEKIIANTARAHQLAELASAHFSRIYQRASNPKPLAELVSTQYGVTTSAHDESGPSFLRVTDINKKPWIEWATTPHCTVSDADLSKYRVGSGDILVARMADPGKAAFIDAGDPEAVFASYLVRLRADDPDLAMFIYYFLRSPDYARYAAGVTQGSVQKNMNAKVIVGTEMPIPSSQDLTEFNEVVAPLRGHIQLSLSENSALASTRDALLPHLMSGKLRINDVEKTVSSLV